MASAPEVLATGFEFIEGPVWVAGEQVLLFNDIIGSAAYQWAESGRASVLRQPTHKANGQALDGQGRLVVCEHETSRLVRREANGSWTVLASHYEGKALNSPNDVIALSDGSLVFTDPPFGRLLPDMGLVRPRELDFCGVYHLGVGDGPRLLTDRVQQPNGLCVSRDGNRLLVNDTANGEIVEFILSLRAGQAVLDQGRVWAVVPNDETGKVDGMKFDAAGNLYVTGAGGVYVFDPDGNHKGFLEVPEIVGNLAFGGPDGRDLFLTASTSLYRTRVGIPGAEWS